MISLRRKRKLAERGKQYVSRYNGKWHVFYDGPCGAFYGDLWFESDSKKEAIEAAYKARRWIHNNMEVTIEYVEAKS